MSLTDAPSPLAAHLRSASIVPGPLPPARREPDARVRIAIALVCATESVGVESLLALHRSPAQVAAARQLAMYLAHVVLGLSQAEVARAFGRDRTTVAHACRRIEDQRDEAGFDRRVAALEACLRWATER